MENKPGANFTRQRHVSRRRFVVSSAQSPSQWVQVRSPSSGWQFFPDFLCHDRKLIIEIDGGTHGGIREIASDTRRTRALEKLGYKILRVDNNDVFENAGGVLDLILAVLQNREDV